jgi:integrase
MRKDLAGRGLTKDKNKKKEGGTLLPEKSAQRSRKRVAPTFMLDIFERGFWYWQRVQRISIYCSPCYIITYVVLVSFCFVFFQRPGPDYIPISTFSLFKIIIIKKKVTIISLVLSISYLLLSRIRGIYIYRTNNGHDMPLYTLVDMPTVSHVRWGCFSPF